MHRNYSRAFLAIDPFQDFFTGVFFFASAGSRRHEILSRAEKGNKVVKNRLIASNRSSLLCEEKEKGDEILEVNLHSFTLTKTQGQSLVKSLGLAMNNLVMINQMFYFTHYSVILLNE